MPLIFQKHIERPEVQANRDKLYIFGDNVQRRGLRGQAAAMRGEPNSHGIATKWKPSLEEDAFFKDEQWDQILPILIKDFELVTLSLKEGMTVIWPEDGIGTGLSRLPITAPKIHKLISGVVIELRRIYP